MNRKIDAREAALVELMLRGRQLLHSEHKRVCGMDQEVATRKPTDRDMIREILMKEFGVNYWACVAKFNPVRRPTVRH
jgi:hypothetical protein